MIFATAGTQLPFDRMLRMLDEIAPELGGEEIVVQCHEGQYKPVNFRLRSFIQPDEYAHIFKTARIVVAHAGTGTIVSAMEMRKPLILIPRKASLGEHRNEHQLATTEYLAKASHICVVHDAEALLDGIKAAPVPDKMREHSAASLTSAIRDFIDN